MRLIEHKTALYGIQIFLRTNIDTDYSEDAEALGEFILKFKEACEDRELITDLFSRAELD